MEERRADRLRRARIAAGFKNASSAARSLGVSPPTYIHHENGTREFGEDAARIYSRRYHVDLSWLLLGEGEQQSADLIESQAEEREQEEAAAAALTPEDRARVRERGVEFAKNTALERIKDTASVPMITPEFHRKMRPSWVWGRFVDLQDMVFHDVISYWAIPKDVLVHEYGVGQDTAVLFPVIGDVMAPLFNNGDQALIDTRSNEFQGDGLYLVAEKDGIPEIRRARKNLGSNPATVTISAEAASYPPQSVAVDAILFIGRVAGRFSRT